MAAAFADLATPCDTADTTTLGDVIVDLAEIPHLTNDRGNIYNASPALPKHAF